MTHWELQFAGTLAPAFVMAVGLVAVLAAWLSYRAARGRLTPRWLVVLTALRIAALLLLVLFLLKPLLRITRTETHETQTAVLVDVSRSMSIRDAAGEKSRLEAGLSLLREEPTNLFGTLSERQTVRVFRFGAHVTETTPDSDFVADQDSTALGDALLRVVADVGADDLSGIVLLTDGVSTVGQDPQRIAATLGVPVFPVALGGVGASQGRFHDVGIVSLPPDQEFIVDNKAVVKVRVAGFGLAKFTERERTLPLILTQDGRPLARAEFTFPAEDGMQEAVVEYTPDAVGTYELKVEVSALTGETITENNARAFTVRVVDPKIRALVVEGVARQEYRFLRRTLESDPNVDLTCVIKLRKDRFLLQGVEPGVDLSRGLPGSREDYAKFDVILLGDIAAEEFAPLQLDFLRDFVSDGGGLLVMGGYNALGPGGYAEARGGTGGTPVADMLPVMLGGRGDGQISESFVPRLTAAGRAHPVLNGCGEFFGPDASVQFELDGATRVRGAKPGATVLMEHPTEVGADGGPMPVIAAQRFSAGHVLVITADTTWKWKLGGELGGGGDSPYYRFWRQAIRWLADREDEDADGDQLVSAHSGKPEYEYEETVVIHARIRDRSGQPDNTAGAVLDVAYPRAVKRADGGGREREETETSLRFVHVPLSMGEYQTTFRPPASGVYRATARAFDHAGEPIGAAEFAFVVGKAVGEFDRVDVDLVTLRALAAETGGASHTLATARNLPGQIESRRRVQRESRPVDLWNAELFFLVFLALVTAEWILRKRRALN